MVLIRAAALQRAEKSPGSGSGSGRPDEVEPSRRSGVAVNLQLLCGGLGLE